MPGDDLRIDSLDSGEITVDGIDVWTVNDPIEDLVTAEIDTSKRIAPDGLGGVQWVPGGGSGGAPVYPIRTETANYTVQSGDTVILGDASSGTITITLPPSAGNTGKLVVVKKIAPASAGRRVIIDGNASELIDGATTQELRLIYEALQMVCDGTGWNVI